MQSSEDGRSCRPLKSATQRRASAPRAGRQLQPLVAGDFRLLLVAACLVPAAGALKTPPPSPPLGSSIVASDSSASRPPPLSDLLAEASRAAGATPAGSSRDAAVSGSRRRLSSTGPPEPSASDTVVTNATHLRQLLLDGGTVSLRLEGHIALGGLPCVDDAGCTLLPWIDTNHRVTLWSDGNATLDAQGIGRIFLVRAAPLAPAPSPRTPALPLPLSLTRACARLSRATRARRRR